MSSILCVLGCNHENSHFPGVNYTNALLSFCLMTYTINFSIIALIFAGLGKLIGVALRF